MKRIQNFLNDRRPLALAILSAIAFSSAASVHGQAVITWKGGNGDFYDPTHWDTGAVPGVTDIAVIADGSTATIAANAGNRELGTIRLGPTEGSTESGHVIMNGGTLRIGGTSACARDTGRGHGAEVGKVAATGVAGAAFRGANNDQKLAGAEACGAAGKRSSLCARAGGAYSVRLTTAPTAIPAASPSFIRTPRQKRQDGVGMRPDCGFSDDHLPAAWR